MNALAKTEPKAQLVTGADVAAIIPRTLEETFRLAGAIAASGLAPQSLSSPEKVMVAIMAGAELGMPPFQSLQSFAVVNGRPCLWGDGLIAVARANGVKVREWMDGHADAAEAFCEVTRPDGETIQRSFSVADAKKAGLWDKQGPWKQYPRRMLQMRARAYAVRDGCADFLRGFQVREEVEDYQVKDVTPKQAGIAARLQDHGARNGEGFRPENVGAGLGETIEADFTATEHEPAAEPVPPAAAETAEPIEVEPSAETAPPPLSTGRDVLLDKLRERAGKLRDELTNAQTLDELEALWAGDGALRGDLGEHLPDLARDLERLFNGRYEALS